MNEEMKEVKEVAEAKMEETPDVKVDVPVEAPAVTTAVAVDTSKLDASIAADERKLEIKKLKRELKVNPGNREAATRLEYLKSEEKLVRNYKVKKGLIIGGAVVTTLTGAVMIGSKIFKKSGSDDPVADANFEEVHEDSAE